MKAAKVLLEIPQGRTFSKVLRWGQPRLAYREIASASRAAPCIVVTAVPHDLPDGWTFRIDNARGMTELNSIQYEGDKLTLYDATVIDTTTIEINSLNAAGFQAYAGGGIITYNMPVDLAGMTAAAQVRPRVDSTEILLSLTTENGGIVLDNVGKTITLQISAIDTAAITWVSGVWDLELTSAGGIVTPVVGGIVKVCPEVTR